MAFSSESMLRTRSAVGCGSRKENAPKKYSLGSDSIRTDQARTEEETADADDAG